MGQSSERMIKAVEKQNNLRKQIQKAQEMARMGYPLTPEDPITESPTRVLKLKKLEGNVNDADVVIVYGDVKGNINNCDNVIVINGDVKGNLNNCDNVAGLLANNALKDEPIEVHPGCYIKF